MADAVVLDFRRVTVIDATGAMLLEQHRAAARQEGNDGAARGRDAAGTARRDARRARHVPRADVATLVPRRRPGGRVGGARDPRSATATTEHAGVRAAGVPAARRARARRARAHHAPLRPARVRARRGAVPARAIRATACACSRAARSRSRSSCPAAPARASSRTPKARCSAKPRCSTAGPRSATAQAVDATIVYEFTRAALDEIARDEPAIAIRLMTNLARLMSIRMRETNEILRELEDSRG